ncbi:hypothetical protein GCM10023322_66400 [Rugosimonospora acidiphila]|uniref:Major facilitator superfamily (MFS) profile domain-containing protein n=1 Tax=Rugosimonospora acidiphila TaxID=556531 RepID=A0ABP9SKF7_9ACTN
MLAVVLCAVGGVLLGGAWSLRSQGARRPAIVVVAVLGVIALAAGVLWLFPHGASS